MTSICLGTFWMGYISVITKFFYKIEKMKLICQHCLQNKNSQLYMEIRLSTLYSAFSIAIQFCLLEQELPIIFKDSFINFFSLSYILGPLWLGLACYQICFSCCWYTKERWSWKTWRPGEMDILWRTFSMNVLYLCILTVWLVNFY